MIIQAKYRGPETASFEAGQLVTFSFKLAEDGSIVLNGINQPVGYVYSDIIQFLKNWTSVSLFESAFVPKTQLGPMVTFEAAALLKEKGFNTPVFRYYISNGAHGLVENGPMDVNTIYAKDLIYSAPTRNQAWNWLQSKGILPLITSDEELLHLLKRLPNEAI